MVSLTGILFYLQLGMLTATWHSLSAFERELDADLIITARSNGARDRLLVTRIETISPENLYVHPNVRLADAHFKTLIFDRSPLFRQVTGINVTAAIVDTSPSSMTFPKTLDPNAKALLGAAGTALVSVEIAEQLGLEIGDWLKLRSVPLRIVGTFSAPFDDRVNTLISRQTLRSYFPTFGRQSGPPSAILARLHDTSQIESTISELSSWLGNRGLEVVRPETYARDLSLDIVHTSNQFRTAFFVAGFVMLVAVIITAQTLRLAITSLRSQFGTLRALGVSRMQIAKIIMELAFWIGIISAAFAASLAFSVQAIFSYLDLGMQVTWAAIQLVSVGLLFVALIAGLLCLPFALSVKPSELLR
ncbi:MAG: FtsX-like permease family protein [Pseudomonadota bacterium]